MPVVIPTGAGQGHYPSETAFRRLKEHADTVEGELTTLKATVGSMSAPLTLAQIQQALSAGGSHPLNLTNLQGAPADSNPGIPTPGPGPSPSPTPTPPGPAPGGPCGARANHMDTVAGAKATLVAAGEDLSGPCGAFKIVALTVSRLQGMGEAAGTLKKTSGNNCGGHATDIVAYADGTIYDCLTDAGGANGPAWGYSGTVDLSKYEGPPCP